MNLQIEIDRKKILYGAKLETYASGEATKEKEDYLSTKSQADSDSDEILMRYFDAYETRITDILKGFMISRTSEDDKIVYNLDVPHNFDFNQCYPITQGISDYLTNAILYKWFSCVWPQKAGYYEILLENGLLDINHRLNQRITSTHRPVRPMGF